MIHSYTKNVVEQYARIMSHAYYMISLAKANGDMDKKNKKEAHKSSSSANFLTDDDRGTTIAVAAAVPLPPPPPFYFAGVLDWNVNPLYSCTHTQQSAVY